MRDEWEEWKPLVDFENRYLISSLGNVKNKITGRVLKHSYSPWGYAIIHLVTSKNGKQVKSTKAVSRLLLRSFVGEPGNYFVAWHRNGRRYDSRLSNLEWVSKSEHQKRLWQIGWNRVSKKPLPQWFKKGNRRGRLKEMTFEELGRA